MKRYHQVNQSWSIILRAGLPQADRIPYCTLESAWPKRGPVNGHTAAPDSKTPVGPIRLM